MFCQSLIELIPEGDPAEHEIHFLREEFNERMEVHLEQVWASKLGLSKVHADEMAVLWQLMSAAPTDYTIFFRELSHIPDDFSALQPCFNESLPPDLDQRWREWFSAWRTKFMAENGSGSDRAAASQRMLAYNPKFTWREWLVAPAYQQAEHGDFSTLLALQDHFQDPYTEQSDANESAFYRLKPTEFIGRGGIAHYSCSS